MRAPDPILIYKAGIKNTLDFAILWHAAHCGATGCTMPDFKEAVRPANENTVRGSLARLEDSKLLVSAHNRDLQGHPLTWTISRIGYRLMTGHLQAKEKPAGQVAMVEIEQAG
jgi:hypothetical protein